MDLSKMDLNPFELLKRISFTEKCVKSKNIRISVSNSKNHTNVKIPQKYKFKCYFCDKKFKKHDNINLHLRLHTGEEPFKCSFCKVTFQRKDRLQQHIRVIHKKGQFECPVCHTKLNNKISYKSHLALHSKPSLKCPQCDKKYFTKGSLMGHISTVHSKISHQCYICKQSFSLKSSMKKHINAVHHKIRKHLCEFCPKRFPTRTQLNSHMNSIHFGQKELIKCSESGCNLTLSSRTTAYEHRIKFHPKPHERDKLKCKLCHKILGKMSGLRKHLKIMHGETKPQFKCSLCTKTYKSKDSLRQHITAKHTAEKSYRCDRAGCNREFALQFQLHRHKKRHVDLELGRKYRCGKCPLVFNHRTTMQAHKLRKHKDSI